MAPQQPSRDAVRVAPLWRAPALEAQPLALVEQPPKPAHLLLPPLRRVRTPEFAADAQAKRLGNVGSPHAWWRIAERLVRVANGAAVRLVVPIGAHLEWVAEGRASVDELVDEARQRLGSGGVCPLKWCRLPPSFRYQVNIIQYLSLYADISIERQY